MGLAHDDPRIPVGHRRRRLHRRQFRAPLVRARGPCRWWCWTSSPTRANPLTIEPLIQGGQGASGAGRHRRHRTGGPGCWPTTAPPAVLHFAAESHVDRSILGPEEFIQTNMVGTFRAAGSRARPLGGRCPAPSAMPSASCTSPPTRSMARWANSTRPSPSPPPTPPTAPTRPARPAPTTWCAPTTTPTALPTLTTNCSNNYGPLPLPREAHPADDPQCAGWQAAAGVRRRPETCATGSMCATTAKPSARWWRAGAWARPTTSAARTRSGISTSVQDPVRAARRAASHVPAAPTPSRSPTWPDRPRARPPATPSIPPRSSARSAGAPAETFESGIAKTVRWVLENDAWVASVRSGAYRQWIDRKLRRTMTPQPMNIVLLGKNGQVGWELQRALGVLGTVQAHDSPQRRLHPARGPWRPLVRRSAPDARRQCRSAYGGGQGRERARTGSAHQCPHARPHSPPKPRAAAHCWCTTAPTTSFDGSG